MKILHEDTSRAMQQDKTQYLILIWQDLFTEREIIGEISFWIFSFNRDCTPRTPFIKNAIFENEPGQFQMVRRKTNATDKKYIVQDVTVLKTFVASSDQSLVRAKIKINVRNERAKVMSMIQEKNGQEQIGIKTMKQMWTI